MWRFGNGLAQASNIFGIMFTQDPIFVAPPPTEVPDYVWSPRYGRPCMPSGRSLGWSAGRSESSSAGRPKDRAQNRPEEAGRRIPHPDAESALRAAKRACIGHPGRWFGCSTKSSTENTTEWAFLVYEGIKVVERHTVPSK